MLVLLPPSETKAPGGDGPAFSLDALSFRSLDPTRKQLMDELVSLAADPVAARLALGLSPRQDAEALLNAGLWTAPTRPALHRYTGVLYDALDARSLRGAAAARAWQRLAVGSALFGLLEAADPVPAYRLSAGSTLPGPTLPGSGVPGSGVPGSTLPGSTLPGSTLGARWRPVLEPLLAGLRDEHGLVVDLRSGSYAALGRAPGAVTVRVLTEHPDGSRSVVSHHNKAHKGRLARLLATTRAEPADVHALLRVLRRAALRVEHPAPLELDLLI